MRNLLLLVAGLLASQSVSERACVVPDRGYFRILVDSAGIFGVFGHDHLIEAMGINGCASIDLRNLSQSSVKLTFSARDLRVTDPDESPQDRAKVQKTMEDEVLRVADYPQVIFESTAVDRGTAANALRIQGKLTIRDKAQPVNIPVIVTRLADRSYRVTGEYRFKQTSFGIKPIQLIGGTVRGKDELRVEFELFLSDAR
jgi:polyisoprenoid-binding protein YceI